MVAGSRSSLRRPALRGDHRPSRSSSPIIDDKSPPSPQTLATLRAKRARASTVSEREQARKRRKLATIHTSPQLRIPLRSRIGDPRAVSPNVVTQSVFVPESHPCVSTIHKSLDSPTPKPQYDQIKIIEEKARLSIRGRDSHSGAQDEKRSLRSKQGGSRSKTDLAQYFPLFDEMLSLDAPDPETLTAKSKIVLIDDTPDYRPPIPRADPFGAHKPLHQTEVLHLPTYSTTKHVGTRDPLDAEVYVKVHKKAERHEKQMKNGDRERAQHEKYQLERLLDDLWGPDWLKTLGISGVTDSEKKRYEPKRALFIRETQALIDKFKWWKEEEKRRKLEREQALMEEAAENADQEDDDSERSISTQPPNSSEIDALASQQLQEEAKSATKRKKASIPEILASPRYKPFTSFFSKPHLRDAAVSGRQRGRTILAFGYPVPDLDEEVFELPNTILTEDAIRASQRKSRRLRREVDEQD